MDENEADRVFANQQRRADNQIAAFRQFYEDLTAEERERFRNWLQAVQAIEREAREWNVNLIVNTQFDDYDANGKLIQWADTRLSPREMLSAIDAWARGENYTPS